MLWDMGIMYDDIDTIVLILMDGILSSLFIRRINTSRKLIYTWHGIRKLNNRTNVLIYQNVMLV